MKILYIAHRLPYPPNKGDKIRSFNEIKYLSQRYEIHLSCLADDSRDLRYEDDLRKYCQTTNVVHINPKLAKLKSILYLLSKKPLSVPYFYSQKLQQTIDHLLSINDFSAVFCFSSPMAEYVLRSRMANPLNLKRGENPSKPLPKLIMDFVDVDSDKWAQYAQYASPLKQWVYRMESRRLAQYEKKVAATFHCSIFVSAAEEKVFKAKNPGIQSTAAIPMGVDLEYFSPRFQQEKSARQPTLVFTGAMDYFANVDGVKWFVREVWPLVRKEIPNVQFFIVGRNPHREVQALAGDGIVVTGTVPDTREYLGRATAVVAPLRIARGIQSKILEAMSMGVPVVATPQAFEGIEAEPGKDLALGENGEQFAAGVIKLLRAESLGKYLGENARRKMERNYCWEKNLRGLERIMESPIARRLPGVG